MKVRNTFFIVVTVAVRVLVYSLRITELRFSMTLVMCRETALCVLTINELNVLINLVRCGVFAESSNTI